MRAPKTKDGIYRRPPHEYQRPPTPLLVDGDQKRLAVGADKHPNAYLDSAVGVSVHIELVPEPGNPWDPHAVALDLHGTLAGYLGANTAPHYQPLLQAANAAGYHILALAIVEQLESSFEHIHGTKAARVSLPFSDDLAIWLRRSAEARAHGWQKPTQTLLRLLEQDTLAGALGDADRRIVEVTFELATTPTGKYAGRPEVHALHNGQLIGRIPARYTDDCPDLLIALKAGTRTGLARLIRYPERIWASITLG